MDVTRFLQPSNKLTPKEILQFVIGSLRSEPIEMKGTGSEGYDPSIKPTTCNTFASLLEILQEKDKESGGGGLHLDEGIHDTFATMVATTLSVKLGALPVWVHVIGEASSGKTTLITALEAAHAFTYSISKFTGMFSGFIAKSDPGMIPKVNGRTMLIKDLTPTLTNPVEYHRIMGELRDIFDGHATASYRNGKEYDYPNVNFGVITCVTPEITNVEHSLTNVGERFLRCFIDKKWERGFERTYPERRDKLNRAAARSVISSIIGTTSPLQQSPASKRHKAATWGFLNHLVDRVFNDHDYIKVVAMAFDPDCRMYDYCNALAEWAVVARCVIDRTKNNEITYRQRAEATARIMSQFIKIGIALCIVFGIDHPNAIVLRILQKLAFDTGFSFQQEVMNYLAYKGKANLDQIQQACRLGLTQTNRYIDDLEVLETVTFEKRNNLSGYRGAPAHFYQLTPHMRKVADDLGLHEEGSPFNEDEL